MVLRYFNKGADALDSPHVGHMMKQTDDKIVIWAHYNWRFHVPKSKIIAVGRNVILGMDYPDVFKYRGEMDRPLPTGELTETLAEWLNYGCFAQLARQVDFC